MRSEYQSHLFHGPVSARPYPPSKQVFARHQPVRIFMELRLASSALWRWQSPYCVSWPGWKKPLTAKPCWRQAIPIGYLEQEPRAR